MVRVLGSGRLIEYELFTKFAAVQVILPADLRICCLHCILQGKAMPGPIGTVDTAIVLIYFAVIVVMGVALSRRQNSTEEYFLGRRNMHWLMVGISIQASLMSTISYLSVPGEQIRNGLMFHAAQLGVFPAILVINFLLLPYFMRRRITTVYELLERRFDLRVRMVGVVIFMGLRIIWMGLVVYTASFAL
ncbi:MAG: hypothetical protein F4Z21_03575, partial [Acidobacteria bacterium]|nr:hypothetical protein [Acidobacteriota bacterium]